MEEESSLIENADFHQPLSSDVPELYPKPEVSERRAFEVGTRPMLHSSVSN